VIPQSILVQVKKACEVIFLEKQGYLSHLKDKNNLKILKSQKHQYYMGLKLNYAVFMFT
jgi:hypothetical protein